MNRNEDTQSTAGNKNVEEQFAAANKVSNIEEDNRANPQDKTEGHMQNGELGSGLTKDNDAKK